MYLDCWDEIPPLAVGMTFYLKMYNTPDAGAELPLEQLEWHAVVQQTYCFLYTAN